MLSVRSMIFQTFRSKNFFHALSTFVYVLSLGIVIQIPGIGEYFESLRPLFFSISSVCPDFLYDWF